MAGKSSALPAGTVISARGEVTGVGAHGRLQLRDLRVYVTRGPRRLLQQ